MATITGGIRRLRAIQLGKETTAGSIAAATTIWRGTGTIEDKRRVQLPKEDIAILGGADRTYVDQLEGGLSFDAVPATFEQLPYWYEAGVKAVGTGATDGTGSGKIYAYPMPTTSPNTVNTYSIEGGDNQQFEVMEYSFVDKMKIAWKAGEAAMISGDWIGRQVALQAKTTTATLPTVEEILGGNISLYIDTAGGTAGTTVVAATMVAAEIDITTGLHPIYTDDHLFFTQVGMDGDKWQVSAKLTFLYNGSAVTEKTAWRNQTPRLLQLKALGSALTTGATYTNKTALWTMPGKWIKFDKIGEQNGDDIIVATFESRYDPTAGSGPSFTVVNSLASLP